MDHQDQLKVQAYLDGELPEGEAREVANLLARDRESVALLGELRNTRQALSTFEAGVRLPESQDFYWSKIRREIERLEPSQPAPSLLSRLRRLLVPVAAVAVVAIAGLVASRPGLTVQPSSPQVETALADSGAFTYRDFASGATLVWLTYPAENDLALRTGSGTVQ